MRRPDPDELPPRLEGEPIDLYARFLAYLDVHDWDEPYEALGERYTVTPAQIATQAHTWHWTSRREQWINDR